MGSEPERSIPEESRRLQLTPIINKNTEPSLLLSSDFKTFPPFHQVGARSIEFQAMPGSETRALRAKIMRHASFLRPGGPSELRIVDCGMRIEKQKPQ
jgi:hypothetical protein